MNTLRRFRVRFSLPLVLALVAGGAMIAEDDSVVETCLACHSPYEDLVSASSGYVWKRGEVQSPHRFVPHTSTTIPECTLCHEQHPLPPTAADIVAMAKPNPAYCYECHHTEKFVCGTCHPVER